MKHCYWTVEHRVCLFVSMLCNFFVAMNRDCIDMWLLVFYGCDGVFVNRRFSCWNTNGYGLVE